MKDTELAKLGAILANTLNMRRNKENRFTILGESKTNEDVSRIVIDTLNKCGIKCEIPDDSSNEKIRYEERGFLMEFANKHIAKEAMNEIFHAFDAAGHDKSNLVGDVFNGISNQLDNAFGNENWEIANDMIYEFNVYENQLAFDRLDIMESDDSYMTLDGCVDAATIAVGTVIINNPEVIKNDLIVKIQSFDREEIYLYNVLNDGSLQLRG